MLKNSPVPNQRIHDMIQRAGEQQQALLQLSKMQWLSGHNDILDSIKLATKVASNTLGVQRCSVWLYDNDKTCIKCLDMYDSHKQKHDAGAVLESRDFPHYFEALSKERIICADDAINNKYTHEFSEVYLKPNRITSMLDAPIWLGGNSIGVLCCEHVGERRDWEIDEQNFAASVADFASIAFELAEHKKTSDELRQHKNQLELIVEERTRELIEKNNDLEAFSYSITHDLRAPLRHISGYLTMLEEDYGDKIDETGIDYIRTTIKSVKDINSMIDSVLKLSKASISDIKHSPVNLSDLLKEISSQIDISSESVTLNIIDTPQVMGDKSLMQIALTNMLENALKYTQKTEKPYIEFGLKEIDNVPTYYIKDNGCGFERRYAEKVFEVFKRLHSKAEYDATRIGLSTVERIIRKHGGQVWADGEVNKGATFYFTLDPKNN